MSDYKRLVAYLYLYDNGAKQKNSGFAKIECQNNRTRISINIRGIPVSVSNVKVYFFKREKSLLQGVYLGEVRSKNGAAEFKAITPTNNLAGSGVTFDEIVGLVLLSSSKIAFATEWDNNPIFINRFEEYQKPVIKEVNPVSTGEERETKPDIQMVVEAKENFDDINETVRNEANTIEKVDTTINDRDSIIEATLQDIATQEEPNKNTEKEMIPEVIEGTETISTSVNEETKQQGIQQREVQSVSGRTMSPFQTRNQRLVFFPQRESIQQPEKQTQVNNSLEELRKTAEAIFSTIPKEEKSNLPHPLPTKEQQRNEEQAKQEGKYETIQEEAEAIYRRAEEQQAEVENIEAKSNLDQALTAAEAMETRFFEDTFQSKEEKENAILDNDKTAAALKEKEVEITMKALWSEMVTKYKRVHPFIGDESIECLRIMPKDIQYLPKEHWVLCSNSFLLHGYYNYRYLILGLDSTTNRFMLGVPGVYHNKEKLMASMFGFMEFKPSRRVEQKTGEFGYWYQYL